MEYLKNIPQTPWPAAAVKLILCIAIKQAVCIIRCFAAENSKMCRFFDAVPILGNAVQPYKASFGGHPITAGCELWAKDLNPKFEKILQSGDDIGGEN